MDSNQGNSGHPQSSTTSTTTTTTNGPHGTTTTHTTTPGSGTSVFHFGTQSTTHISPTVTTTSSSPAPSPTPAPQAPAATVSPSQSAMNRVRSSSIRIRRPSSQNVLPTPSPQPQQLPAEDNTWQAGRRRSSSEPRPPSSVLFADDNDLRRQMTATPLQPLYEEGARTANGTTTPDTRPPTSRRQGLGMRRQTSALNIRRGKHQNQHNHNNTMDSNVVDVLDVIGKFQLT
jgi:hypothetical protein